MPYMAPLAPLIPTINRILWFPYDRFLFGKFRSNLELRHLWFHQARNQMRWETAGHMLECEARPTSQRLRSGAHGYLGQSRVLLLLNDLAQGRAEAVNGCFPRPEPDARPDDP